MKGLNLTFLFAASTLALNLHSQVNGARFETYSYLGLPYFHEDGKTLKMGGFFQKYPELYNHTEATFALEEESFKWQGNFPAFIGIRIFELYKNTPLGAGMSLETGYISFKGIKSATESGQTARMQFDGTEYRLNLKANLIGNFSPLLLFLNFGFSTGYAKNYTVDFNFDNGQNLSVKDGFFRNSDFRFLAGLELQYYLHKNWVINLGAEHYAVTLHKIPEGLPGLNELYGFRYTSLHLGAAYSIPFSRASH